MIEAETMDQVMENVYGGVEHRLATIAELQEVWNSVQAEVMRLGNERQAAL